MKGLFRLFCLPVLAFAAVAAAAQDGQAPKDPEVTPTPASSSSGATLFPMPAIPADPGATALPETSSLGPSSRSLELFPMPAIPDEDLPSAPAPLTEAELEMQALIQSAIGKNPTLGGGSISVAVSSEGIELSGTVPSARAKLAASRLAKSYAAGRKVVDKITVAANPPETPAEPAAAKADTPGPTHQHP